MPSGLLCSELKSSRINCHLCPSCPLEVVRLQPALEFKTCYISQILPVPLFSRWGERFLVLPTQPSSQNLLWDGHSIQAQRWTAVSQSHLAPDPGPWHPATLQRWLVAAQLCPRTQRPVRAKPSVGCPRRTPVRVPPYSIPCVCRSAFLCRCLG